MSVDGDVKDGLRFAPPKPKDMALAIDIAFRYRLRFSLPNPSLTEELNKIGALLGSAIPLLGTDVFHYVIKLFQRGYVADGLLRPLPLGPHTFKRRISDEPVG